MSDIRCEHHQNCCCCHQMEARTAGPIHGRLTLWLLPFSSVAADHTMFASTNQKRTAAQHSTACTCFHISHSRMLLLLSGSTLLRTAVKRTPIRNSHLHVWSGTFHDMALSLDSSYTCIQSLEDILCRCNHPVATSVVLSRFDSLGPQYSERPLGNSESCKQQAVLGMNSDYKGSLTPAQ